MTRHTRFCFSRPVLALLALTSAGCTSAPLVGQWNRPTSTPGMPGTATLTLAADGTATWVVAVPGCTGSWTNGDWTWSTTGTTLSLGGTYGCTGSITCGSVVLSGCHPDTAVVNTGCDYALSADRNTLSLTDCLGSSSMTNMTFTRGM